MEVSMEAMHVRFASPSADITQDAMYKPTTTHGTFCYQSSYIYQKHITQASAFTHKLSLYSALFHILNVDPGT